MTSSEIHLHHFLCESRGFKIGKSSHRRCSIKKVQASVRLLTTFDHLKTMYGSCHYPPTMLQLRNFNPVTLTKACIFFFQKNIRTCFFLSVLWNFREHIFHSTLLGDYFWIGLIIRKFNSVSQIFLNSQLYGASRKCSLFWCNEEHLLIKKHN